VESRCSRAGGNAEGPRHLFVPPINKSTPMSTHPCLLAIARPLRNLTRGLHDRSAGAEAPRPVLEIGTGSGYQAAVLAELVQEVYTIEIVEPLAKSAKSVCGVWGIPTCMCGPVTATLGGRRWRRLTLSS